MSITTDQPTRAPDSTARRRRIRLGMRWKLVFGFGLAITIVFFAVAGWILSFSTNTATTRLKNSLVDMAEGGVQTIDVANFSNLLTIPERPTPGTKYPANAGFLAGTTATAESTWPTDPAYWQHVSEMLNIRRTNPDASPYTYATTSDGELRFIGQWGAYGFTNVSWCADSEGVQIDDPCGAQFKQSAAEVYGTVPTFVTDGLLRTTPQPAYTDALNTWISVYTPIKDTVGNTVGALGVDYPLSYVNDVRSRVLKVLYPVFGASYLVLLVLVYFMAGLVTRRLGRITSVTQMVADGDYSVDVTDFAKAYFRDEMTELADNFQVMTLKVGERERSLTRTVAVLRVEIDEAKRMDAVKEIVDSDFFNHLTQKAAAMRAKVKNQELQDAAVGRSDSGAEPSSE